MMTYSAIMCTLRERSCRGVRAVKPDVLIVCHVCKVREPMIISRE